MNKTILTIIIVAVVLVVAAGVALWAFDRYNDSETTERGSCADATYELSAEEDDGSIEVTFEVQSSAPGETWQIVIEQDGTEVYSGVRQTDEDAELDVDVTVSDQDGSSFTATATPETGEPCSASIER
jgi:FlaG/FlaF family flagellin (archaellin)